MLCRRQTLHRAVRTSNTTPCFVVVKHCTVLCRRQTPHHVLSSSNTAPCCADVKHCTVLCRRQTLRRVVSASNTAPFCVGVRHCIVLCKRQTLHRVVSVSNTALSAYSRRTPCCDGLHDSLLLQFFSYISRKISLQFYFLVSKSKFWTISVSRLAISIRSVGTDSMHISGQRILVPVWKILNTVGTTER